jgi:SAM-dependent methyltransferase
MQEKKPPERKRFSPMWTTLASLFPKLVTGKTWDREYARGDWDLLETDQEQLAHYLIVLGYLLRTRTNPRILDVGCGTGRLLELIERIGMPFERYLGVDLSNEAVKRARARAIVNSDFVTANASDFSTTERFDAVVFNEVIYYFSKPAELVSRYAEFLREGGVLIASMYKLPPIRFFWKEIDGIFQTVDVTWVRSRNNHEWQIRLLEKR